IVVGREADHDLQLNFEDGASRQHCRLSNERGQCYVEDLGSRNGTKVTGKRIAVKTAVRGGDVVEVGKVKIGVVDQAGAAARAPARSYGPVVPDERTVQDHSRPERAVAPRPAVVADERTVHDRSRPERAVAPRP